jgi:hypothetical protein
MGIVTIEKSEHLFWLGRYTERVHTELKYYLRITDIMIDLAPNYYAEFCRKIGVPDVYSSREAFLSRYPFDEEDPNSIISNLHRAYDNAIVLRNEIGTETMAYIQLAIDDIKTAERGNTPLYDLTLVIDHTLAFWGCINDRIEDEAVRNIIKLGMGVERLDLYLGVERPLADIQREYRKLKQYLLKSHIRYDENILYTIDSMLSEYEIDCHNIRNLLRNLIVS